MNKDSEIASKCESPDRLAKVSSRTKLYHSILRHEASNEIINANVGFVLSIYFTWLLVSYTNVTSGSRFLTETFFENTSNPFEHNSPCIDDTLDYLINHLLIISIYLVIVKLLGKGRYLSSLLGYNQEKFLDPFDKNLLEENCQKEINKIGIDHDDIWTSHFLLGVLAAVSVCWVVARLEILAHTKKVLISGTSLHWKLVGFLTNYYLRRNSASTFITLRHQINFLFNDDDIFFVFSSKENNLLSKVSALQALFCNRIKFEQMAYFERKISSSSKLYSNIDEHYYLMMVVKQIIEVHFGVEVVALDDQFMLIKANKIVKLSKREIAEANQNAHTRINYLYQQMDMANKYIKLLEIITQPTTNKKWKRIFDIDCKNLFSFSLNVAGIENVSLDKILFNVKKILPDFNVYFYGDKLVVEGDLKGKFQYHLYTQAKTLISTPITNSLIVNPTPVNSASNVNIELIENKKESKKTVVRNTNEFSKKNNPKVSGRISFLFTPFKRTKLINIVWKKFHNYPIDKSPYTPIRHACSNKVIFYSAFTLEKELFTTKEPQHKFLSIVKTEHLKASDATGSCIKFLDKDERLSLKARLRNLGEGDCILFKLHTDGDSRVYGVLKDKGIAQYDDGSKVEVKMIEWCIIDQQSHNKSSTAIYHSSCNPYIGHKILLPTK